MKKKILSAVLAVVICFSAFSFVAVADEGAKTSADLQALVNSFSTNWLNNDLWEYGTLSVTRFEHALEAAQATLADGEAESKEFTVAYILLEAANDNLLKKTYADLTALVVETKATYNKENEFNAAGDAIYKEGGFDRFVEAYEDAELTEKDEDTNTTTDRWVELNDAFNALEKKDIVTRAQINALDRTVNRVAETQDKFTPERRGNITVEWGDKLVPWILLWDDSAANKNLYGYGKAGSGHANWIPSGYTDFSNASDAYAKAVLDFQNLDVSSTTDDGIVGAYKDAMDITTKITSFSADGTSRSSIRNIETYFNTIHKDLVQAQNSDKASDSSLALAAGQHGAGALAELYKTLPTAEVNNTNVLAVTDRTSIPVVDAWYHGKPSEINIGGNARAVPDMWKYVGINATVAGTTTDILLGSAELDALTPGIDNSIKLGQAYGMAQNAIAGAAVPRPAGYGGPEETDLIYALRVLTYAVDYLGFSDDMETRVRLEALIGTSEDADERNVKFFDDLLGDVRDARGTSTTVNTARWILRESPTNNRADNGDNVFARRFYPFYEKLNDAVNAYNDGWKNYPIAMNSGENSVFDVIYAVAGSADENVIALRTELALRILENDLLVTAADLGEGWGGIFNADSWRHYNIFEGDVFTGKGAIDPEYRVGLKGMEPWNKDLNHPIYNAYFALANAAGINIGNETHMKGDVNGDSEITSADALQILLFVAGLPSVIDDNPRALVAASITAEAPSTACALAILYKVAGLPSALD